jgi:transcriptional regulator with XRE-family HTH domain
MLPEKIIGHKIKVIREQKGLKLELLAKHLGVSKGRVSQIENGQCCELTINRIAKIAQFLEVDFFEIISNKVHMFDATRENDFREYLNSQHAFSSEFIKKIVDELINRIKIEDQV